MKEKRERQPNWSEAEKQLLLSLTRKHQNVIENKSSDSHSIRRKAEVWEDITKNMKMAGYNRSKERLKQQLGRIRAAEVKRMKEALENHIAINNTTESGIQMDVDDERDLNRNSFEISSADDKLSQVKQEIYKDDDTINGDEINKPLSNDSNLMQLLLNKIQTINAIDNYESLATYVSKLNTDCLPCTSGTGLATSEEVTTVTRNTVTKLKKRNILMRSSRIPSSGQERLRQLHMYRIGVERERLRTLKLQQKQEMMRWRVLRQQQEYARALFRKDERIQNLKIKILQTMVNKDCCYNHNYS